MEFLAAAAAAAAGLSLTDNAQAQTASPSPKATAPPSSVAQAFAERMRQFDPQLTEKQLNDIAHQIDQGFDVRTALRPKGRGLSNGDAPVPQFGISE
jgi:hypothetical protein